MYFSVVHTFFSLSVSLDLSVNVFCLLLSVFLHLILNSAPKIHFTLHLIFHFHIPALQSAIQIHLVGLRLVVLNTRDLISAKC